MQSFVSNNGMLTGNICQCCDLRLCGVNKLSFDNKTRWSLVQLLIWNIVNKFCFLKGYFSPIHLCSLTLWYYSLARLLLSWQPGSGLQIRPPLSNNKCCHDLEPDSSGSSCCSSGRLVGRLSSSLMMMSVWMWLWYYKIKTNIKRNS